jgi:hypothetical protein
LKEIAAQEGVTLSQALEILATTSQPEGLTVESTQEEDFWSSLGFPNSDRNKEEEVEDPTTKLDAISSQLESFRHKFSQFFETQRLNIVSAVSQAFEEQASWAKLQETARAEQDRTNQHVHDRNCQECNTVAEAFYIEGKGEALEIPGAREAIKFFLQQQARNEDWSGEPVVEDWTEVPGVKELIQKYQHDKSPVTFVDSEPQQLKMDQQVIQTILDIARNRSITTPWSQAVADQKRGIPLHHLFRN